LNDISYIESKDIDQKQLLNLYIDAGWTAYTAEPEKLMDGVRNSLYVVSAWDEDKLVGILRAVGDGNTILYIQDIIVQQEYKRHKIGSRLVHQALEKYKDVRQKVLITEDHEETRKFYESLGFESCDKGKGQIVAFAKINRFTDGLW
jgi:ribosomal protein S18 acetylase RimI-like enzyme